MNSANSPAWTRIEGLQAYPRNQQRQAFHRAHDALCQEDPEYAQANKTFILRLLATCLILDIIGIAPWVIWILAPDHWAGALTIRVTALAAAVLLSTAGVIFLCYRHHAYRNPVISRWLAENPPGER